jgi:SAM-dependent methyltransferase
MRDTALIMLGGAIGLAAVGWLAWRLGSRRRALPCPVWLRWMVELDNPFTRTNRAAVIVELLDVRPGMTVLDAGCGPGRLTVPLAEAVGPQGRVVALDLQAGMLDRAAERVRAAGCDNVAFVQAGLGDGALERDHFDRAVLVTVLGEIPDRDAALRDLFDALRPAGVLSITEVIFDPHFQPRAAVLARATAAGFRKPALHGHRLAYTLHVRKPEAG